MRRVLAAERAVFAHFNTLGGILFVLERIVVPLLALAASQRDFDSHIGTSLYYLATSATLPPCSERKTRLRKKRAQK